MTQTRPHVTFDSRMYRRPKRRRLVIVNKMRFIFATILALILLSIIFSYITGNFLSVASTNQEYLEITVVPGDTLWDIASQYNYYDDDIRQVLYDIQKTNQMTSSNIYPGQVLVIPVSK
ncbi:LysM peptidoglycan-binding domain-containing protein [Fusibacter sp. 3D3]|uniref:cell division suppressor protein YneA n=1 Tax=Fusibacter sp. 3D3 TaxID=1048380 RepID=UPI000853601B|nr:LysM peptidoglycan-binding domain-containing protein [Fusibacter sp. 3D3]GAU79011.1 peptidoglycan-binding LysM [Fusibacter sp. 3D3]